MNFVNMEGYTRISKAKAIKMFSEDVTIRIVPCKYSPDNQWNKIDFNRLEYERENMPDGVRVLADWCFNNFCVRWTYYNGTWESGYYPAFYVKQESI